MTSASSKAVSSPAATIPSRFNYRMHQAGGEWKVTDVYLAGNISQMAQKRSDFGATLSAGGPQGLAKKINALTDQMLNLTGRLVIALAAR